MSISIGYNYQIFADPSAIDNLLLAHRSFIFSFSMGKLCDHMKTSMYVYSNHSYCRQEIDYNHHLKIPLLSLIRFLVLEQNCSCPWICSKCRLNRHNHQEIENNQSPIH